jgi:hypothetical protein
MWCTSHDHELEFKELGKIGRHPRLRFLYLLTHFSVFLLLFLSTSGSHLLSISPSLLLLTGSVMGNVVRSLVEVPTAAAALTVYTDCAESVLQKHRSFSLSLSLALPHDGIPRPLLYVDVALWPPIDPFVCQNRVVSGVSWSHQHRLRLEDRVDGWFSFSLSSPFLLLPCLFFPSSC